MVLEGRRCWGSLPEAGWNKRLGIPPGQRLDWIEDGLGGFRVVPHSEDLGAAAEAHEAIMAEYEGVFRELAK